MSRFQITYLPMIWLLILETILNRRLNVSMTHWTPFSHLSLLTASADNMGACANCVDPDPHECAEFPNFKTLTQDNVSLIIRKAAMKSCPLDPVPTYVVLQVLDVLLPAITCMINIPLDYGLFAEECRQALELPSSSWVFPKPRRN